MTEHITELPEDPTVAPEELMARPTAEAQLYARLATPFDVTFRDLRGGVELEYITGEQATTRLNETLGFLNWSFRVLEHGIHAEADECWTLGEITVTIDGRTVTRQQFGSQKLKRSRSSGTPLDIGFDLKGAATDALKKCASLVGVALYLWHKEGGVRHDVGADAPEGAQQPTGASGAPRTGPTAPNGTAGRPTPIRPPATKPTPISLDSTQRAVYENQYRGLRVEALDAGMRGSWIETEPEKWTDPQLVNYTRLFETFIEKNPRTQAPAFS